MKTLSVLFILISFHCYSQEEESFINRIYFPFDAGIVMHPSENISAGLQVKTGLEYRFQHQNAPFVRFNYDTRANGYAFESLVVSNVLEGNIRFSDLSIGLGYHLGLKKVRFMSLIQVGKTAMLYPNLIHDDEILIGEEKKHGFKVFKSSIGLLYYILECAALTLEFQDIYYNADSGFWKDQKHNLSVTFGVTATLF